MAASSRLTPSGTPSRPRLPPGPMPRRWWSATRCAPCWPGTRVGLPRRGHLQTTRVIVSQRRRGQPPGFSRCVEGRNPKRGSGASIPSWVVPGGPQRTATIRPGIRGSVSHRVHRQRIGGRRHAERWGSSSVPLAPGTQIYPLRWRLGRRGRRLPGTSSGTPLRLLLPTMVRRGASLQDSRSRERRRPGGCPRARRRPSLAGSRPIAERPAPADRGRRSYSIGMTSCLAGRNCSPSPHRGPRSRRVRC